MSEDVKNRLDQLIGETKVYKGKIIKIEGNKDVNNTIVVYTDARTFTFLPTEIEAFFRDIEDVSEKTKSLPVSPKSEEIQINGYQPSAENVTLKSSLMDVLKSINESPTDEALKKAKAICDVANTMVNIQKTEVQMINAIKRN